MDKDMNDTDQVYQPSDIEKELDWILLRKQLADARREEDGKSSRHPLLYLGLLATVGFFSYGLFNMNNQRAHTIGGYGRIGSQVVTLGVLMYVLKSKGNNSRKM